MAPALIALEVQAQTLVHEFFAWVRAQNDLSSEERGLVKKALGYAIRQALRSVATGRKAWLLISAAPKIGHPISSLARDHLARNPS